MNQYCWRPKDETSSDAGNSWRIESSSPIFLTSIPSTIWLWFTSSNCPISVFHDTRTPSPEGIGISAYPFLVTAFVFYKYMYCIVVDGDYYQSTSDIYRYQDQPSDGRRSWESQVCEAFWLLASVLVWNGIQELHNLELRLLNCEWNWESINLSIQWISHLIVTNWHETGTRRI